MDILRVTITKILKGAVKSFYRFPASIVSAIVISFVGIIRINMGWEAQESYNFLFNSIQLSFLLGAVSSMAAVVFDEIKPEEDKSSFILANGFGILLAIISFLFLYFFGGIVSNDGIKYLSDIANARMIVLIFVSAVLFVYLVSKAKIVGSFSDSFFITHRAFAISAIYGLVIMIGVSGVLGAFQALVYREMGYKVYQYLGVVVGFLIYTIFLGYFPNFRANENIDAMKEMEEQPRFIYVLLGYILVPIMMALTVVLLIWSARLVFSGIDVSFNQLSGIASSYVIVGIWLHIMVAKHESKMAMFYKRVYPFSAILVLIFEAWALVVQLSKFGLKTAEYSFTMIWIFALISVVLLILLRDRGYRKIAIVAIVISIIWVLPFIGYQDLTFNSQVNRLEDILMEEGLLVDDNIVKAEGEVEGVKRGEITDAVDFISYSEKKNTPIWFKKDLNEDGTFRDTFGFEKTYGIYPEETDYTATNLSLKAGFIDISEYDISLNISRNEKLQSFAKFKGKDEDYEIIWSTTPEKLPKITVKLGDSIIIERDLGEYLSKIMNKYPPEINRAREVDIEDMSLILEGEGILILFVFDNINIYFDRIQDRTDYYTNLQGIYVKYK